MAGVCAVFGLFSIDIGLHLQYRYRANRVKGMYEKGVDESLSRYARGGRAAHAKEKLLTDHGVWWISSLFAGEQTMLQLTMRPGFRCPAQ